MIEDYVLNTLSVTERHSEGAAVSTAREIRGDTDHARRDVKYEGETDVTVR